MFMFHTRRSSVINLINSGEQLFSYTVIKGVGYLGKNDVTWGQAYVPPNQKGKQIWGVNLYLYKYCLYHRHLIIIYLDRKPNQIKQKERNS
jgi:hypothetical protein